MSDVTIGAVMEVLGGEYYGGILGGIDELGRRAASLPSWSGVSPCALSP